MSQSVFFAPADRRALILPGLAADGEYTFQIRAYRKVDKDVALAGLITSDAASVTYQPSTEVAFNGDITGTIQGRPSLQVVLNLEAIASDLVLSTAEKPALILEYNRVADEVTKVDAKAATFDPDYTAERNAVAAAKAALDAYLATLTPAWNDTSQHTAINATTFRNSWQGLYSSLATLSTAISGRPGAPGANGLNSARVLIYQRAASEPARPSVSTTYTFASGALTGLNNGWSTSIPAANGQPLWVSAATASGTGTTDTIAAGEWVTPAVLATDGASGTNGLNQATVFLCRRSPTSPPVPSVTSTFTFSNGTLTGQNNGWTQGVPAGTDPVWVITAAAISTGATDTILTNEWSNPTILAQNGTNGANGLNTAAVFIYQRAATAPAAPTGTVTYTFDSGAITGSLNGWTTTIPAKDGNPLWVRQASASSTTATDTIAPGEWSLAQQLAVDGAPGSPGTAAITGNLTNDPIQLFAFANGAVSSYAGATGNFVVMQGGTNVSSNFALSTLANPQGLTVSYAGQTYTITGGFDTTEDTASLTIRATGSEAFAGVTVDRVLTLSKAKGGYEIVATLPTTNLFEGRIVFLTTDDKLYRYTGTAWTAAVPAVDISGQLADAQIAALAASKVTGQLTDTQIAALAAAKLTGQITQTQITDASISTSKLAATAVTADKIAASAVVADKIASNAVTAVKIQAGAVEAAKIAAGAVEADKIAANAVIAGKIAANAVTATQIASNAITADKINAGAVTAAKINVTSLTALTANIGEATAGILRNAAGSHRIDLNAGRIIFDNGTYIKASGVGFGTSNQFIEWFGVRPTGGNLALCSEANAIQYLKTNGDAYFGGSLSAGILRNAATATGLSPTEQIELGPFGSNGGSRVVVVSYTYYYSVPIIDAASWTGTPSATVVLERWNGSSWSQISTFGVTGSTTGFNGFSEAEPGSITITMGGSTTFTDTSGGTSIRYRARLTARSIPTINSTVSSSAPGFQDQQVGIISTEE